MMSKQTLRVFQSHLSVTASILMAALAIGCSQAENKNAIAKPTVQPTQTAASNISTSASPTTPPVSNTAVVSNAPPVSRGKGVPPEGGDIPRAAEVNGYPYSYKTDGGKTVATFSPKILPANRDLVTGAIRDIIYRSYGDKVNSDPRIEGKGASQTIRIDSSKHKYIVVPTSEPTGEIHSLIITQLN